MVSEAVEIKMETGRNKNKQVDCDPRKENPEGATPSLMYRQEGRKEGGREGREGRKGEGRKERRKKARKKGGREG